MNLSKKMLQHLDEIDGIVLACREKMMEKAGNDSLQHLTNQASSKADDLSD